MNEIRGISVDSVVNINEHGLIVRNTEKMTNPWFWLTCLLRNPDRWTWFLYDGKRCFRETLHVKVREPEKFNETDLAFVKEAVEKWLSGRLKNAEVMWQGKLKHPL